MNTICNIRLTPEKVVENGLNFGIPIYQRLFAWDGKQVYRLMDNLYSTKEEYSRRRVRKQTTN